METKHVRLSYEEAIQTKKNLLSSEINILQLLKKISAYKDLRRKETASKNNLQRAFKSLNTKIRSLELKIPEEEKPTKRRTRTNRNSKKSARIEPELEQIKRKLEKLGQGIS